MSFERTPLANARLEDLDQEALTRFLALRATAFAAEPAVSTADQRAEMLGLIAKSGPRLAPTPVGLLLFGRNPQLLFPEWGVSVVAVDGRTLSDPLHAKGDLEGPVTKLLEQALAFVRHHTRLVSDEVTPRHQHEEHPAVAVREALVNALVHRDLRKTGRVTVRVFADRLEIWNPGGASEGMADLEDAVEQGGVSLPRNPLLAATARALGIGEQIGRGLVRIRRAILDGGADRLHLRTTPRDFLVVMPSRLAAPCAARELT
jgi:ATP-dependent DNA helicase RecG